MESNSLTPHPATTIAAKLMYPLSPHLWNMPAPIRLFLLWSPGNPPLHPNRTYRHGETPFHDLRYTDETQPSP